MALEDALVALGEHWDDVASWLEAAQLAEIRALISQLGGPGQAGAVTRIADILTQRHRLAGTARQRTASRTGARHP